jgi:hypothetical protein
MWQQGHNLSMHRQGLHAIFQSGGIPAYSSYNNTIIGGASPMQRNNAKFLAIVADCLKMLDQTITPNQCLQIWDKSP